MPPDDWGPIYADAGQQYGVDPNLLRSLVATESAGNPKAVSSAGAQGPAQLMPATAKSLGVTDPTDPTQAIPAAARLLRENFDRYGDPTMAVAAYHGGTDQANWGPKTQDYVRKVSNAYSQYLTPQPNRQQVPQAQEQPSTPQDDITSKIEAARAAGYSDEDITAYLQKNPAYAPKFDAARKAGYSDDEIYGHLGLKPSAPKTAQDALSAPPETPAGARPALAPDENQNQPATQKPQETAPVQPQSVAQPATPAAETGLYQQYAGIAAASDPKAAYTQFVADVKARKDLSGDSKAELIGQGADLTMGEQPMSFADFSKKNPVKQATEIGVTGAIKGAVESGTDIAQAPTAFRDRAAAPDNTEVGKLLQQPVSQGWKDPNWWAAQIGHGAGGAAPSMVLGAVGATAAGALAPESGPVAPLVGGAAGFGLGSALGELAPAYQKARADGLDHDAAVTRAMEETGIAGTFGTAMGLAPGASLFGKTAEGALKRPISEALAQIFGVQPGIGAAQQEATGAVEGKTPTAGELATGYAQNVGMGAAMTAGHQALHLLGGAPHEAAPAGPDGRGPIIENPPQPGQKPLVAGPRPGSEPVSTGTQPPIEPLVAGARPGAEPTTKSSQDIIDYAKQNLPTLMPEIAAQESGEAAVAPVRAADIKDQLGVTWPEAQAIAADHNENVQKTAEIDKAAAKVDPNPTEAQIDAGNYQKASVSVQGIPITIETPKGGQRTGTAPDGTPWAVTLQNHYGYIRGTEGADGDHVDTYVGPYPTSKLAYVVDQIDPATGLMDEHKAILGARNPEQATQIYDAGFSDNSGAQRRAALTEMSIPQFKDWIKNGDTKAPLNPNVGTVGGAEGAVQGQTVGPGGEESAGSGQAVAEPAAQQADIAAAIQAGADPNLAAAFAARQEQPGPAQDQTPAPPRPTDLIEFLAQKGGLKDFQGELRNLDAHKRFVPGYGMLVRTNGNGISMDYAREAALEAGYPVGESVGSFLDALETNLRGTHVFSHQDSGEAAEWEQHRQQSRGAPAGDENELYRRAEQLGIELQGDEHPADVADMVEEREAMMAEPDAFLSLAGEFDHDIDFDLARDLPEIANEIPWTDETAHRTAEAGAQPETARGPPEVRGQQENAAGAAPDGENLRPEAAAGREPAPSRTPTSEQTEQGRQLVIPGGERSARQAAEAREDQGRGRIAPKVQQKQADEGLFGGPPERELFDQKPAEAAKAGPQLTYAETTHTTTGAPLFVAKLEGEKLPADEYKALLAEAKRLGGYYSSFRGKGAIPGFQFKDKANAERFIRERGGVPANLQGREEASKAPDGQRQIGVNAEGRAVFEDKNGVRSVVDNGIRSTEPVLLLHTRSGIRTVPRSDSTRDDEYKLVQQTGASPESERSSGYGADNKIFTQSAADRAREVLRAKLSQLNSGFDPEIGLAGLTLAGYHIEAGARNFADYTRAMVGDLGRAVEPYLRSWYEAVRHHPGLDTKGMSTPDEVDAELQEERQAPTLNVTEAANGIQEPVRPRDEGPGTEDVSGTGQVGEDRPAPSGEERRGAQDAEGTAGRGAEGLSRPAGESAGSVEGRGNRPADLDRVSGTGEGSEPGAARRPAEDRPDADVKGTNYRIEPGALEETRGPKTKARDNLAAIELTKRILTEDRLATKEEQAVLAKYVGWGGLSGVFPDSTGKRRAGFEDIGERLQRLLTPDEHEAAATSTQYAHYTSEPVVRAMWDAVRDMGFDSGNVFEPGMGIGHFVGLMPDDIAAKSRYEGIERDPVSASIAKLLYPKSGVREADFIKTPVPDNTFDLAIGNPPFADTVIQADPKYRARGFMLHDYFFAKSLDSVRPGGLLGFITSAGTMNKMDEKARHFLAERAEFVGGVRLPGDAFSKNAGTSVTTDMLFFKRRPEGRIDIPEGQAPIWTQTIEKTLANDKGEMIAGNVSRYFNDHPEQVLGKEGWTGGQYKNRYGVEQHPGTDLPTDLRLALDRLPKDVMTAPLSPEDKARIDFSSGQKKDGSFYLSPDGKLMQYSAGAGREVGKRGAGVAGGMSTGDRDRIVHLVPIRDALRDVFAANLAEDVAGGNKARKELNGHYDRFVKKFGPINKAEFQYRRPTINQAEEARLEARQDAADSGDRFEDGDFDPSPLIGRGASVGEIAKARKQAREAAQTAGRTFDEGTFDPSDMPDVVIEKRPNIAPFMSDPESYRLRSIESYDDSSGESSKKAIFRENILKREPEPVINSANDGVLWSLNKHGRLDLDAIAQKLGTDRKSVIDELGDSVYKVPGTDVYQTSDEYLSGDIVSKMEIARSNMDRDPDMRRNLTALQAAMPVPLSPSEISVTIGMPWVSRETYQDFVNNHMRLGNPTIRHSAITGRWTVDDKAVRYGADRSGVANWSTPDRDAYELLSDAMNRTPPKIYDTVKTSEGTRSVFNAVATQAAQDKMEAIKQAFSDWVESDPARNDGLAKIYNDNLNRSVLRKFDGSYLTTPGIVSSWGWRPHQLRVVARIIQAGSTYMAHAVGAGKTSAMIGAGMEMRRLGLVSKPMYTVPNHMLSQFTKEFYEQYPTARIAVADERNFHTDRRKQFMANVAQDDLDAVIITHSSFGKIPVSDEFQDHLVQEQLDQLAQSLGELDPRDDRITIKNLKNMKEKLEQKLSARGANKQDLTNTFEEMGVDFLFVDEAHLFRKLSFATQQTGLKGITAQGSNMAWDLYSKARYLDDRKPGRSLVLASGTPITNTMGELFSLSRYMQPQALESRGLAHFDSWAQTFGDTAVKLEAMPDGSYKPVTRFSKFVNLPELYKMVGEVMDIVTPNELEQYVTRPQLKGGERKLNIAPFTDNLADYQQQLASRMAAIAQRSGPPKKGDDIILSVINDGRHSAIDPRFVMAAGNDPDSKLNMMISNAAQIWRDTKDKQFFNPADGYRTPLDRGPAAQMIFANLGVNGRGPVGFSTYAWIKSALLREGVPADQIAFIGDYKDHAARQALFRDVNSGKKRILVGSTQKMGTGVNAQRRLYALHNLDPLWFPADDEQRVGRALRQGNTNPEIEIHDYTTKDTYDQTMWGMMGRKGRFIEQFFRGDPNLRDMEDLGEASAFEQAAAMSTSDPRLMQLTDMKQELDKAERRANAHDRDQYSLRQRLSHAISNAQDYTDKIDRIHQDIAQRVPTAGDAFSMTVDGRKYSKRKDAAKALEATVTTALAEMGKGTERPIGQFGGFPLRLRKSPYNGEPEFTLIGKSAREINLRGDTSTGGDATIQSAEYRLRNLETDLDNSTHHLTEAEKEAASIRPLIGKEFKGGENIADLRQRIRALEDEMKPKEEAKAAVSALPTVGEHGYFGEPVQNVYSIAPGIFGHISPKVEENLPALAREAARLIEKIAPGAEVRAFERLESSGKNLHGAYVRRDDGLPHVIAWSLESPDVVSTAKHEAIHYLRQSGLLTDHEWKTLSDAAEKGNWIDSWDVRERWKDFGLTHDQMIEEAVAEQYANSNGDYGTLLDPIFQKIHEFLARIGDVARRILGRNATADDVFSRIDRGEVGTRVPGVEREGAASFQPAPIDATPEEEREHAKGLIDRLATPIKKLLSSEPAQKVVNGETARNARAAMGDFYNDVAMKVDPLSLGLDSAKAAAKDFANEERRISYHLGQIDKMVASKYTPAERANMGAALDEQSVMDQVLQAPLIEKNREDRAEVLSSDMDPKERAVALAKLTKAYNKIRAMHAPFQADRGLGRLPEDQRALTEMLDGMSQRAWKDMKDAGIVAGAGLPHYMPRYFVNLNDNGVASRIVKEGGVSAIDPLGANLRTSGPGRRKHMTTEETEAAAKTALGDNASLVKDIRALLVSLQRSQRSVAGKELIKAVKTIGHETGTETVSDEAKPGFFTIDHPAFTELGPSLKMDEDGNMVPRMDDEGKIIMARRPIYVSREFEGPLRSVLNTESGSVYRAFMALKSKTMGIIMYSPVIHNAVEWGRALSAMPGKVATFRVYFEGNRAKNDPATMDEAISAGLVPIGQHGNVQDITGVANDINIEPGRSWTAKGLAVVPGLFDPKAGVAVKRAVDKMGNLWHNTLLWDRVADLQAGLYVNMRDENLAKGWDRLSAAREAAHFANRFAGAIPREAMSSMARKIANIVFFSRTFTFGNLGAMKDMVRGMPSEVQAQILRDSGAHALRRVQSAAKRRAIGAIALDIALYYAGNAILQSSIAMLSGDTSLSDEAQGYARRFNALFQRGRENPLSLWNPIADLDSLTPQSENEPNKQDRVLVGYAKDGTAIYMRNPVGKIGEEFSGWLTHPLDMLTRKFGTIIRPTLQLISNDQGYGRQVYDPYDKTPSGTIKNIGRVINLYMGDQIPQQAIKAASDYLHGRGDPTLNAAQVLGPLAGLTFSKGAPGGPAVGQLYQAEQEHRFKANEALPAIRQKIADGDVAGASKDMNALGISPLLQKFYIRTTENPKSRLSPSAMKAFGAYATPEQQQDMERALEHH